MTQIDNFKCISCLACIAACPHNSIRLEGLSIIMTKQDQCNKCENKLCKIMCPTGAISIN